MRSFTLPYGKQHQTLVVPPGIEADLILPREVNPAADQKAVVRKSLDSLINFDPGCLLQARRVAIAINDKTRPVPHQYILPPLLEWLDQYGVSAEKIEFWIATGSHLPMQPEEFSRIVPEEICNRYSIRSHNIDDLSNLVQLGMTSRGTPVIINRAFYEADVKIVVGDIEPHHFAGFSGGYKTAVIGLGGRPTINHNHSMLKEQGAWIAVYDQNPLRQDIEEAGQLVGVDLALNTILTTDKQVVAAVAGAPLDVMQAGIPLSRDVCGTRCDQRYPIVIASAGGSPKDINFYQAQKALTHASLFAEPGGILVLVAECIEGSGSKAYEEFMQGVDTFDEVFKKFAQIEFRVGPHKAFQVARLLSQYSIILVSTIAPQKVSTLLMTPADSIQVALDKALRIHPLGPVAILPHATTTVRI